MRIASIAIALGLAFASASATQAGAATTFGTNLEALETPTQRPSLLATTVSLTDAPATARAAGGVTSPIDGVIVRWRIRTAGGTTSPAVQTFPANFRVLSGNTGVAIDQTVLVKDVTAIQTFPTRIPVRAGDRIGLDTRGGSSFFVAAGGSLSLWQPVLGPTETRPPDLTDPSHLTMNADVEPDADGDGFGDDTQDGCPSDASRQSPCDREAPRTTITTKLGKLKKPKVKVEFSSDDPAAAFECALDSPAYKPCSSPLKLKRLKGGKHTLGVRATDAAGNVGTAAIAAFKVVRRSK